MCRKAGRQAKAPLAHPRLTYGIMGSSGKGAKQEELSLEVEEDPITGLAGQNCGWDAGPGGGHRSDSHHGLRRSLG